MQTDAIKNNMVWEYGGKGVALVRIYRPGSNIYRSGTSCLRTGLVYLPGSNVRLLKNMHKSYSWSGYLVQKNVIIFVKTLNIEKKKMWY